MKELMENPTMRSALSMFATDIGLDIDAAKAMLKRALNRVEWANSLRDELRRARTDQELSWCEHVFNEHYEIDEPASEKGARELVLVLLSEACDQIEPME